MTNITMAADTIGLPVIANWFKKLNAKMAQRAKIQTTINQLSALTDRELRDLGISRGDIYSVAHGTADIKEIRDANANLKGWV